MCYQIKGPSQEEGLGNFCVQSAVTVDPIRGQIDVLDFPGLYRQIMYVFVGAWVPKDIKDGGKGRATSRKDCVGPYSPTGLQSEDRLC